MAFEHIYRERSSRVGDIVAKNHYLRQFTYFNTIVICVAPMVAPRRASPAQETEMLRCWWATTQGVGSSRSACAIVLHASGKRLLTFEG